MTEVATKSTTAEVAAARLRFKLPSDYDANTPGDWAFIVVPLLGIGAGLLLRNSSVSTVVLWAIPAAALFGLLGMKRPSLVRWWNWMPTRPRKWQEGLVEISCTGCGKRLDWATPDFAARPAHYCPRCVGDNVPPPAVIIPQEVEEGAK